MWPARDPLHSANSSLQVNEKGWHTSSDFGQHHNGMTFVVFITSYDWGGGKVTYVTYPNPRSGQLEETVLTTGAKDPGKY